MRLPEQVATHSWAAGDQIASGTTNLLLPILVAGSSSQANFGYFMVAYSVFTLLLVSGRNFFSVAISMSSAEPSRAQREADASISLLVLVAPALIALVATAPLVGGTTMEPMYLIFGIGAAIALLQDVLRYLAIATGAAATAAASDVVWLLFMLLACVWRVVGRPEALDIVGLWTLGAAAGFVMLRRGKTFEIEPFRRSFNHIRETLATRNSLLGAAIGSAASVTFAALIVTRRAGPDVNAAISGASQLMAPVSVGVALMSFVILPVAARRPASWSVKTLALIAAVIATSSVLWATALSLVPESLGTKLLGASWVSAQPLFFIYGFISACVAIGAAASIVLVRHAEAPRLLVARSVQSAARVLTTLALATLIGTAVSISYGELLINFLFASAIWWSIARRWVALPEP